MGILRRKPNTRPASTITIHLIVESQGNLTWLQDKTRLSTTDIINRAIQVYAFTEHVKRNGGQLIIKEKNGTTRLVVFK